MRHLRFQYAGSPELRWTCTQRLTEGRENRDSTGHFDALGGAGFLRLAVQS